MDVFHLTFASTTRLPLFADDAAKRAALRALASVASSYLALFYLVDDHLHAVLACDRARAGRLKQALYLALLPIVSAKLDTGHLKPVDGRSHLLWLVRYVLGQGEHHGLAHHPALWEGSCFQDLIGARDVPGLALAITELLPRLGERDVLGLVGLPGRPILPAADEGVAAAGLERLVLAAASATAAPPDLRGKSAEVMRARKVVAALGIAAGFTAGAVAVALEVSPHTVRRLARGGLQESLALAVRKRLALEDAVRAAERGRKRAA